MKKNYFYNLLLSVVNILFPILSFPYASHILGPVGIGKVQFVISFAQYFALLAAIGIPIYGIKETATMIGGSVETCGDIANPVARGAVEGDLFDLCSGRVPGRRAPAEITVFRTAAAAISISWSRAIWDRRPDRGEGAEKA